MTHIDPHVLTWFRRTTGSWKSDRRYLFAPRMEPSNMVTTFTIEESETTPKFIIRWKGQTSGIMDLTLEGNRVHRSRDYFGNGAHSSVISMIDEDTILLRTVYDNTSFREEVRLLLDDTLRLRQTVGTDITTGNIKLLGQYAEIRQ